MVLDKAEQPSNPITDIENTEPRKKCQICFDEFTRLRYACDCNNAFCDDCITLYITTAIEEGIRCVNLTCPGVDCSRKFTRGEVAKFVSPNLLQRYTQMTSNAILLNSFICPNPDCSSPIPRNGIIQKYDRYGFVNTFQCTDCSTKICLACLSIVKNYKVLHFCNTNTHAIEVYLRRNNARRCPGCCLYIQKTGGCDHMRCQICAHEFCYRCGKNWSDHIVCDLNTNQIRTTSIFFELFFLDKIVNSTHPCFGPTGPFRSITKFFVIIIIFPLCMLIFLLSILSKMIFTSSDFCYLIQRRYDQWVREVEQRNERRRFTQRYNITPQVEARARALRFHLLQKCVILGCEELFVTMERYAEHMQTVHNYPQRRVNLDLISEEKLTDTETQFQFPSQNSAPLSIQGCFVIVSPGRMCSCSSTLCSASVCHECGHLSALHSSG